MMISRIHIKIFTKIFLYALLLIPLTELKAEDLPLLPEEESPASFLETDINSDDVQLFLTGNWKISLEASTSFGWSSISGFNPELKAPGFNNGFTFSQSPDFTVSLIILDRYFFDAYFSDEFADSTFRLGYKGAPGEVLQKISAGNMDISMSSMVRMSEYFMVPGGGPSSFGIYSMLQSGFSSHELLFRFDPEQEIHKFYEGTDLITKIIKDTDDYINGRFFEIPASISSPVFYIEKPSGSGSEIIVGNRSFYPAAVNDYSYSPSKLRLVLKNKPESAVMVHDNSDNSNLIIYDPGLISNYELSTAYYLNNSLPEETWKTRVFLGDYSGSYSADKELTSEVIPEEGTVILQTPVNNTSEGNKLVFIIRSKSSGYSIDNPVKGTIRIFINDIETFDWSESGGIIKFNTPPGPDDRIEIIYRKNTSLGTGGDLLFASANNFTLPANITADINTGVRWNISQRYSTPGNETSSYGEASAGLRWSSSEKPSEEPPPGQAAAPASKWKLSAGVNGGIKILTNNSSGCLLLNNMSDSGYKPGLNRNTVFPAAPSAELAAASDLDPEKRGELIYKDYRVSAGISSWRLQDYNADLDPAMVFKPSDSTYADRYKAGPYTAAARADNRKGEILVMDYSIPSSKGWTGVQIPLAVGSAAPDLSGSRAFSFDCRAEGDLSGIKLYIEIGSLSEDLDADGQLDAETSEYSGGFIFNDQNSAAGTLIGGDNRLFSNGIRDSEDFNQNGLLDPEKQNAVVLFSITSDPEKPDGDWRSFRFNFSDSDVSVFNSRKRLTNAEFIRITAVSDSSSEVNGRIMFDDFMFEGASMTAEQTTPSAEYSVINESLIQPAPASPLSTPTLESKKVNSVMMVSLENDWELFSYTNPLDASEYGSIVFHIYCPSAGGAGNHILNFSFTDTDGLGIKAEVPFTQGGGWKKIELRPDIDSGGGQILVDGNAIAGASFSTDWGAGKLTRIQIGSTGTGVPGSIIFIDEIYLLNPSMHIRAGVNADFKASTNKPVLSAGWFNIIGPLDFYQSVKYNNGLLNFNSSLQTVLLGCKLNADFNLNDAANTNIFSAGHILSIPIMENFLDFKDIYRSNSGSGNFYRAEFLSMNSGLFSGTYAGFSASLTEGMLVQNWDSIISFSLSPVKLETGIRLWLAGKKVEKNLKDNYFAGWIKTTALAASFSSSSLIERKTSIYLKETAALEPLGINTDISFEKNIKGGGESKDSVKAMLALPFIFRPSTGDIKAELSFYRSGSFIKTSSSKDFGNDIYQMFSLLGSRTFLYDSIPVYELFDSSLPERFYNNNASALISKAELKNSVSFNISRNYSSSILDLFIPYALGLGFKRSIIKDYNDLEDSLGFNCSLRGTALNLFGKAGVYPFFNFYFSDEFRWSAEMSISSPFSLEPKQKYLFSAGMSFFGSRDQLFTIDGKYYLPINVEKDNSYIRTDLTYIWDYIFKKALIIPFIHQDEQKPQKITNEEKLSLNFKDIFSTELKHTTSLMLSKNISISAFGLMGLSFYRENNINTILTGLSMGVSGNIIY